MPSVEEWLAAAVADAERRGLADLKPLLASLARATAALRAAAWNERTIARVERTPRNTGAGTREA